MEAWDEDSLARCRFRTHRPRPDGREQALGDEFDGEQYAKKSDRCDWDAGPKIES